MLSRKVNILNIFILTLGCIATELDREEQKQRNLRRQERIVISAVH